jgi:hypothetical protein
VVEPLRWPVARLRQGELTAPSLPAGIGRGPPASRVLKLGNDVSPPEIALLKVANGLRELASGVVKKLYVVGGINGRVDGFVVRRLSRYLHREGLQTQYADALARVGGLRKSALLAASGTAHIGEGDER